MDSSLLAGLALTKAEAALKAGSLPEAWEWLQAVPLPERPAAWVAACLDSQSRRAAADADWVGAVQLAELALTTEPSPARQERVALLRRRRPMESDHEWAVIRAKVGSPRRLALCAFAPQLNGVAACGAYHSRGSSSDAPWSQYLRMTKSPPIDSEERRAVFALASRFFSRYIAEETDFLAHVDAVVPVPANPGRYVDRMASLPDELAVGAGAHLGLPVYRYAVKWRQEALDVQMKRLGWSERRLAAAQAFERGEQGVRMEGRSVLLVDDICTSGSTLRACATVLRACGALVVFGCCLAHTEG